jgi:ABC-type polysaccharide/polyol phosphate transport system ATPase subunit
MKTGEENLTEILGMTKKEIASKIDEIIEFSGCERYIDTPVKGIVCADVRLHCSSSVLRASKF